MFLILPGLMLFAVCAAAQVDTTGLVAWYPFSGNAGDSSGHSNNGTVYSATLTTDRYGRSEKAYSFDGSNDYILIPDNNSLDFTTAMTISAWIKPAVTPQEYIAALVCKGYGGGGEVYCLDFDGAGDNLRLVAWNGVAYVKYITDWLTAGKVNIWTHLAVVYNGAGSSLKFYENGSLIYSTSYLSSLATNSHELSIGSMKLNSGTGYTQNYNGAIDDIRLYNRALADSEILDLYNECLFMAAPIPISPVNNQLVNSHDVNFLWNASDSAVSYHIQVSPDSTFGGVEFDQSVAVPETATIAPGLLFSNYFWRVRAYLAADTTAWSALAKFRIDTIPPEPPVLVSPVNGVTLTDSIIHFHWNPSVGGTRYRILVTTDSLGLAYADSVTVDTTGYRITNHLPDSLYYWKVKAVDSAGNWSDYSEQRRFKASIIPRLISPPHNATIGSHTLGLNWHAVYGTVKYRVQASIDSTFAGYEIDRYVTAPDTATITSGLIYNKYYWRVRTYRGIDTSAWSANRVFNISAPPPAVPVLISPDSGEVVADSQPHFQWGEVANIWLYHFEVSGDSLFSVLEDSINTDTTVVTVGVPLSDGVHWWRVRSYDNISNWSDFSTPWKFTLENTGVEGKEEATVLPQILRLSPARPNPSRVTAEIDCQLPRSGPVTIEMYNVAGARVATLVDGPKSSGHHTFSLDLKDDAGRRVANGVYILRLTAGASSASTKITVIR
jgi:hypothetical protein